MTRRTLLISVAVVAALSLTFVGGYRVGLGDRTTVPNLYGLDGTQHQDVQVYVTLKNSDLRMGRTRLHICGDAKTRGMVVKQFPTAGTSVPVGSAVDIWTAVPEGEVTLDFDPGVDHPCHLPPT
jgi:beta-lactam-binding protein with PASTA domain